MKVAESSPNPDLTAFSAPVPTNQLNDHRSKVSSSQNIQHPKRSLTQFAGFFERVRPQYTTMKRFNPDAR
jgi:hypothetical protein